jgi:uncharacterized membrane protein
MRLLLTPSPAANQSLPRPAMRGSRCDPREEQDMSRHWVDITAIGFFIIEWLVYAATLEHSAYGRDSLSARMNRYREVWVRRLLDREARMVDMQIMASLQNGTAFFASTSLLALGGALALLHATNDAISILGKLPIDLSPSPALWELKCVGLVLICVYAFFKFAWAYRLFNYVAILFGGRSATRRRPKPMSSAPRACSNPPAATSTAASAPSSSRSAISAGSSAPGCCS